MALTQKLELRQSQALVMTPQLMQAIKLLQLSNLDLVAYVDAELERNPLLERLNEEGAPQGPEPNEPEPGPPGDPGSGDWLGQDLATSRTAIEDQLGTKLDNVFPDDAGSSQPRSEAPAALSGRGRGRTRRPRRCRLQSGGVCHCRDDARRSSGRTIGACGCRSGATDD